MRDRAVPVWCALVLLASCARAPAYTVDCNHDYADCDNQLSKFASEDEESTTAATESATIFLPTIQPKISSSEENATTTEKNRARLLALNVDELQSFANALHNNSKAKEAKKLSDLSDVNLDNDEEELPMEPAKPHKVLPDKFFTNLQAPFHPSLDRGSEESGGTCKENNVFYKMGDRIERGCDETCECSPEGTFECAPRCKHPYIRRGRRLTDPLCFESPVDECCSIIACATGNGDKPTSKVEVCRHNNDTYAVGAKWSIGCEQLCTCERQGVVDCKPRCAPLPQSDKCINVQDPHDACCEVQVCDVSESEDVHEVENATAKASASATTEMMIKQETGTTKEMQHPMRPLVLTEPIGSVTVLQNNSVQVTLMHMNITEDPIHLQLSSDGGKTFKDIELKYDNLILNLEGGKDYVLKTKETDTKFNFTITASDSGQNEVPNEQINNATKIGCYQDGQFYAVGEEFHIGCSELCECTGQDTKECAALECPNHVGLELVSRGCVRWATSPPAKPPDCCPRMARCLSDGTCHYRGVAIPNWSEVPISLTGCEERCFCENGELDCQEVCSPLPPVPPQTLRCPPMHRAAPVNISDEDCCKQWGCLPNLHKTIDQTRTTLDFAYNFVTPIPSTHPYTFPLSFQTTSERPRFTNNFKPFRALTISKLVNNLRPESKHLFQHMFATSSSEEDENNATALDIGEKDYSLNNPPSHRDHSWDQWPLSLNSLRRFTTTRTPFSNPNTSFSLSKMSDIKKHKPKNPISLHDANFNDIRIVKNTTTTKMFIPSVKPPEILPRVKPSEILSRTHFVSPITLKPFTSKIQVPKISHSTQYFDHTTSKYMTALKSKDQYKTANSNTMAEALDNRHVLTKEPNAYETVLLRTPAQTLESRLNKYYSTADFDDAIGQMDMEEANKNLERSADEKATAAGATMAPATTKPPPFLPTVAPDQYPHEEIPDYDQNNIHRPNPPPLPPGLPPIPGLQNNYGDENKKLSMLSLQADSPTSIKMLFGLPPVLVGLRGSVDLRYTDKDDKDITHWYSQVFAPADEVLTTSRLEFRLTGLKPSTVYKVRGKLYLHNLPVEPESEIYSVRTQDLPVMEEKQREIDSNLVVVDLNDTTAIVSWRHFTEEELRFIDGVQVRYRPVGTPIYLMTELLHHSRSTAELKDLRPGIRYEASLVLIAPPKATTELNDPSRVQFTTAPLIDPYNWSVTVEAHTVGSEAVEVTWRGVPSPAERWVRVYRAAHACGDLRATEHDAFRLAARDQPPKITLTGLEPDAKCRIWLELFLTNGKVKTSNVLEVNTKSLDEPEPIDNVIEASSVAGSRGSNNRGDYYGALVVVGVVAALGAVTSLLLLLIVLRRHRPRSADITPVPSAPRESSLPPYDNPAYKLELQQETMDL